MSASRSRGTAVAPRAISKRLVFAYAFDWVILVILGIIGYGFTFITPHFRPFSPIDLSISFPYNPDTISIPVLAASCVVAPVVIIGGIVVLFVPGVAAWKRMSRGEILRIKIWELNVGFLGLALAQVTQFLVVQGTKTLLGKPRPNLLARCQPDLANLQQYVVGAYGGQDISPRWVLVDQKICTASKSIWLDAFKSFPSGHNSTAFAGMLYLSLYLASKFGIGFPTLPFHKRETAGASIEKRGLSVPSQSGNSQSVEDEKDIHRRFEYRDEAAGPPVWTALMVYIPLGVAIYIASTRYFDFYHDGFDVIGGAVIGLLSGWLSFRWYHGPLGHCAGWAWGPRSRDRAFGIGVGTLGYVTSSHRKAERQDPEDVELANLTSANNPRIRPSWQRDDYESLRSFTNDDIQIATVSEGIRRPQERSSGPPSATSRRAAPPPPAGVYRVTN